MNALNKAAATVIGKIKGVSFVAKTAKAMAFAKALVLEVVPVSPQRRLVFYAGIISTTMLASTSLTAVGTFTATPMGYSTDYISSYALPGDILVSDDDGYLVKINPQTNDSNRIGLTDFAVHTVESGESLSVIAARYDVSMETVLWENNIRNANAIRSGQKLLIPPVDGISYKVGSGDSVDKLAEKYDIESQAIIAHNNLDGNIIKGQNLFLPGAKPIAPPVTVAVDSRSTSTAGYVRAVDYSSVPAASSAPATDAIFIYPSRGKITQGYKAGHYAIDIADTSRPPIWAAGAGTVTKVSTGTWGGGYGNHIIIDHGGGLKSLYAHLDSVNVSNGQWVNQGDVIGIMGNTGRVYGVTGIHLHWEVILNGVKQNPNNYY
ncbi:peptidoglycan DD-metalloendopeptidase family protein [Candidatus Peregrinibacteria bacterium]|nr:peptidoglycan DD-metalloendopeptidase family protein [Candidatus Peregrinibacteria bacterium]